MSAEANFNRVFDSRRQREKAERRFRSENPMPDQVIPEPAVTGTDPATGAKEKVEAILRDTLAELKVKAPSLKPTPEEAKIIERSTQKLIELQLRLHNAPSLPERVVKKAKAERDLVLASLANIGVTHGINAAVLVRDTVYEVMKRATQIALEVLISA